MNSSNDFRSYFSDTVEAALARARCELGEDAILLGSRRTSPEETANGAYEVRFQVPRTAVTEPTPLLDPLRMEQELSAMRRQIDAMFTALSRSVWSPPRWLSPNSDLAELLARLIQADVAGDLAQEVTDTVHAGGAGKNWMQAGREALGRRISVQPDLGEARGGRRIVALLGPPGAGKTTTLVKLAIRFGLTARRSIHLVTTDDFRVGGAEQLREFAAILGVGFQLAPTVSSLAQMLEENSNKDLIMIDTPGITALEADDHAPLASYLASRNDIDRQLLLMASLRTADLWRVWETFRVFQPTKIIFTRVDETSSFGSAYTLAARTAVPVSFITSGQRIPEDLHPASQEDFAFRVLPESVSGESLAA